VQSGTVSDISGSPPTGLFYRIRVKIVDNKLHNVPEGFSLTPGMPIQADINVGKRTLMEYMLKRVLPTMTTGMREPQ
jgi:HlyD family secretion protein